jgi:hypothetical protein
VIEEFFLLRYLRYGSFSLGAKHQFPSFCFQIPLFQWRITFSPLLCKVLHTHLTPDASGANMLFSMRIHHLIRLHVGGILRANAVPDQKIATVCSIDLPLLFVSTRRL